MKKYYVSLLFIFHTLIISEVVAQKSIKTFTLQPADSFNRKRTSLIVGTSATCIGGVAYWTYTSWYRQFDRDKFHFFNDNQEWLQMDKAGHIFSTYSECSITYGVYRWAGLSPRKSTWISVLYGMSIQTSLEMADAFSKKWGFSLGDYAANIAGASIFASQALLWKEQRIQFKVSSQPKRYPDTPIFSKDGQYSMPLSARTDELLGGNNYILSFLKDYNEQSIWASVNPSSFLPKDNRFPKWLNIAVGYSGENMFVGDNAYTWTQGSDSKGIPKGTVFQIDAKQFPRYRQYLLSFDLDLTKVKVKNRFLKTFFYTFSSIKIPSPTLEINSLGKVKGHWFYF
jgi:hypothetical protein